MEDYIMLSKLLLLPPRWLNQFPGLGSVYLGAVCASSVFLLSSICHFWNMSICTRVHVYTFSSSWISLTKTNVAVTPLLWWYHEMMKWCGTSREGAGPVQGADPRTSREVAGPVQGADPWTSRVGHGLSKVLIMGPAARGWELSKVLNLGSVGLYRSCPRWWFWDQWGRAGLSMMLILYLVAGAEAVNLCSIWDQWGEAGAVNMCWFWDL